MHYLRVILRSSSERIMKQNWTFVVFFETTNLLLSFLPLFPSSHIQRQLSGVDGVTEIEITGSQMVLTMKLISFAWSCHDGQQPPTKLDKTQQASRIDVVPNLLQFLGYW